MLIANLFLPYRRTTYQETDSRLIEKQIHGFFFYCTLAEVIKFRQCSLIFVQIIRSLLFQLRNFFCRFIHSIQIGRASCRERV